MQDVGFQPADWTSGAPVQRPGPQYANVLCCVCGAGIQPNPSMMCVTCLRSQVDITEGISKQLLLPHCKECNRYQKPPWVQCELESRELLALCLKKIKGLNKVKLVDASFIWTEPHSRRIKVKLTVQREVVNGAILQQSFTVEFVVQNHQCDDCKKQYTPHTWDALVQIRQRTDHKRTFMFLEQLIIKHEAHEKVLNIVDKTDGLDFQFANKSHAQKFLDFVSSYFPAKSKVSKQLISHDAKNNTYHYKHTYFVELCPVCKDDLVYLPPSVAAQSGGISNFLLCTKMTQNVALLDPFTMRVVDVPAVKYWQNPFKGVFRRRHLTEFIVLDIEEVPEDKSKVANRQGARAVQRHKLVDVEIARAIDLGKNDDRITVRTHLGTQLRVGDHCMGYDMRHINLSGTESDLTQDKLPADVILVKKTYPARDRKAKKRAWTLKTLPKTKDDGEEVLEKKKKKGDAESAMERDLEEFRRDLEEDPEMRREILLFKDPNFKPDAGNTEMEDGEEMGPEVELTELLDGLNIDDDPEEQGGAEPAGP